MYKVILVDDQPLCLKGMESTFEWGKYGFEIVGKTTNQDIALEMIRELNPDVLCTDMRMPQISGMELIKAAKMINSRIECIIVSGYEDFDKACEAIRYNVFRYCLKPLDKKETECILRDLKEALALNHPQSTQTEENSVDGQIGAVHNLKFKKMLLYINDHFQEAMSLGEVAKRFNINVSFASRLFSQYFKMGYSQYLSLLRLRKSRELLQSTQLSIEKISYIVGFNDSAYFSKLFKKHYGVTPYEFRCRESTND